MKCLIACFCTTVYLDHCLLATIFRKAFYGLLFLRSLSIRGGNYSIPIDHIECDGNENKVGESTCPHGLLFPPGAFSVFQNLQHLTLDALTLNGSIWGEIGKLRKLKELSMQDNTISILDKDTISNLNELQTLDLSKNDIQTILVPRKTFYTPGSNLRVLDLSRNKINDISNGAFDGLEKVEIFKLRGNQITILFWFI